MNLSDILQIILISLVLLVVAFKVIFFIIFVLAGFFEKRPIREFSSSLTGEKPELSAYARAMNHAAEKCGLTHQGMFKHAKGGTYHVYISLWLSPKRDILAVIGRGKMLRMSVKKTSLISKNTEDKYLETLDDFGEYDLTGILDKDVKYHADFEELLAWHRSRIAHSGRPIIPFSPDGFIRQFEAIEFARINRLEQLGYARFIDAGRNQWRYTLKGALLLYFRGMSIQRTQAKKQIGRAKLKRPGDKIKRKRKGDTTRSI